MSPSSKTVGETWIPFCLLYLTIITMISICFRHRYDVAMSLTGVLEVIRHIDASVGCRLVREEV